MSRLQKHAWFNLVVVTLSIIAFLVLLSLTALRPAVAAFGLMGLLGLGHLFYRERTGDIVPLTVLGGWVVFVLVQSATTLILYGKPGRYVTD